MFLGLIPIADIDHRVQMSTGQILQVGQGGWWGCCAGEAI